MRGRSLVGLSTLSSQNPTGKLQVGTDSDRRTPHVQYDRPVILDPKEGTVTTDPPIPASLDPSTHGLDPLLLEQNLLDSPQAEPWKIDDDSAAEWALRHVREAEQALGDIAEKAKLWQQSIVDWEAHEAAPLLARRSFFEGRLIAYQLRRRLANPDAKTLNLPSGKVTSLPATSTLAFDDNLLQTWAVDRPELVRVKVEPALDPIRKAFVEKDDKLVDPETGEIIDGATVTQPVIPFSIKVKPTTG